MLFFASNNYEWQYNLQCKMLKRHSQKFLCDTSNIVISLFACPSARLYIMIIVYFLWTIMMNIQWFMSLYQVSSGFLFYLLHYYGGNQ